MISFVPVWVRSLKLICEHQTSGSTPMGTAVDKHQNKTPTRTLAFLYVYCVFTIWRAHTHTREDFSGLAKCRRRGFSEFHTRQDSRHNRCFVRTKVFQITCAHKRLRLFRMTKAARERRMLVCEKDFEMVASSGSDNCIIIGFTKALFKLTHIWRALVFHLKCNCDYRWI